MQNSVVEEHLAIEGSSYYVKRFPRKLKINWDHPEVQNILWNPIYKSDHHRSNEISRILGVTVKTSTMRKHRSRHPYGKTKTKNQPLISSNEVPFDIRKLEIKQENEDENIRETSAFEDSILSAPDLEGSSRFFENGSNFNEEGSRDAVVIAGSSEGSASNSAASVGPTPSAYPAAFSAQFLAQRARRARHQRKFQRLQTEILELRKTILEARLDGVLMQNYLKKLEIFDREKQMGLEEHKFGI